MKTKQKIKRCMTLLLVLVLIALSTTAAGAATPYPKGYKSYSYMYNGRYVTDHYTYPSQAKKYGIPESYFKSIDRNKGYAEYFHNGGDGGYSYYVLTSGNGSKVYKDLTLSSAYIVWIASTDAPTSLSGRGAVSSTASVNLRTVYSSGAALYPLDTKTPMVSVSLLGNNPDLISSVKTEMCTNALSSQALDLIMALPTSPKASTIIKSAVNFGKIVNGGSGQTNISLTKEGAREYKQDLPKYRAAGIKVPTARNMYSSKHILNIRYNVKYPVDTPKANRTLSRSLQGQFKFRIYTATKDMAHWKNCSMTQKVNYKANSNNVVTSKYNISKANISGLYASYKYTGKAITPNITLKHGNITLEKNDDYTVKFTNNTKKGTATVTITGKDEYTGTIKKTFKITK